MSSAPDLPWQRLHPLSPVIQMVRGAAAFVLVLALPYLSSPHNRTSGDYFELAVIGVAALGGVISWLVTRWRIQDGTLRVETGLVRRRHTQIPLQRIQSVDVVRPALARLLGLAEVRVRTGVAHRGDARLAYIPEERADRLRADLLLWSRGAVAAPADSGAVPLAAVRARRLLLSVWLDGGVPLIVLLAIAFAVAATVHASGARAPLLGAGAGWMLLGLVGIGSRLNSQLGYEVLEEPDGLTVRGGLIGTVVETIPRNRIQAVRLIAPLLWRPLGWVRLEVDVAGGQRRQREDRGAAGQMRTLLPVATRREAEALLAAIGPKVAPVLSPAPRRAAGKAPLRYHFLGAGTTDAWGAASAGRIRRVITWVPLAKVQSVRWTQGPLQRRLRLASVHLDIPGRRVGVILRDRSAVEAHRLAGELPDRCRQARHRSLIEGPPRPEQSTGQGPPMAAGTGA